MPSLAPNPTTTQTPPSPTSGGASAQAPAPAPSNAALKQSLKGQSFEAQSAALAPPSGPPGAGTPSGGAQAAAPTGGASHAPTPAALPAWAKPVITQALKEEKPRRDALVALVKEAEANKGSMAVAGQALIAASRRFAITPAPTLERIGDYPKASAWEAVKVTLTQQITRDMAVNRDWFLKSADGKRAIEGAAADEAGTYEPLFVRCTAVASALAGAGVGQDERFALDFAREFKAVLGAFKADELTAAGLAVLFSAEQRAALSGFFATHVVPEGLFTSAAATGKATVPQRTLLASQILTTGVTQKRNAKGDKEGPLQKPQAQFCGHWVQFVLSYAGANAAKGADPMNEASTLDIVGATGQTSFGGGKANNVLYMGKMTKDMPMYGRHKDAKDANDKDAAADPKKKVDFARRKSLEEETFSMLQPGDWIYIYNANGSTTGEHSEVFVGWVDEGAPKQELGFNPAPNGYSPAPPPSVRYKTARVFSQLNNDPKKDEERGGFTYTRHLGYPFAEKLASGPGPVCPVTAVTRPSAAAAPPRTAEQLLDFDRPAAVQANLELVQREGIDLDRLHAQLAASADALLTKAADALAHFNHKDNKDKADRIVKLRNNLEPSQKDLCLKIRKDCDAVSILNLTTLVALGQRVSLANKVDGKLGLTSKNDVPLLGGGGVAGVKKQGAGGAAAGGKDKAKPSKLDYRAEVAASANGYFVDQQQLDVGKLADGVAQKVVALKPTGSEADKQQYQELLAAHQKGKSLASLSALVALWQSVKSPNKVTGWTADYKGLVGADGLQSAKRPASP